MRNTSHRNKRRRYCPGGTRAVLACLIGIPVLLVQLHLIERSGRDDRTKGAISSIAATAIEWERGSKESHFSLASVSSSSSPVNAAFALQDETTNRETLMQGLPTWLGNYIDWHGEQRRKFPGAALFTDPEAPPVLIRTCYRKCGGLHDRLGKLPWDLYLANQTKRVLLMNWCHPAPLEEFLLPNILDWTVPALTKSPNAVTFFHNATTCAWTEKLIAPLFDKKSHEDRPRPDFWSQHLDAGLIKATTGVNKDAKILRHRILGDETVFHHRLEQASGGATTTDFIDWTPTFGKLFWIFFRPAPAVQKELNTVFRDFALQPGRYSAVHCRVRHPKATKEFSKGKTAQAGGADRVGLLWQGAGRDFAVETAVHALQCGQTLLMKNNDTQNAKASPQEPIYFYSDSEDLVRYMTNELNDAAFLKRNASIFEYSKVDAAARAVVQQSRVVGRHAATENLHIDRQGGAEPAAYYGSFVDLLVGARSRCVTYGVGNYALFSSKISGSECRLQHQAESWGVDETKQQRTQFCSLDDTSLL